jgi:quinohemoprotein ethanol dehydrogenase
MSVRRRIAVAAACLLAAACQRDEKPAQPEGQPPGAESAPAAPAAADATVVDDAALTEVGDGRNWLGFGRNYSEQRYSPLEQVNVDTVSRLGLLWFLDLPGDNTLNATPLAVDGVLYFTGSYSKTRAVDAKTGKLLWEYDPKPLEHAAERMRVMWDSSRGLAYWNGKVIIATIDGRLVGLDAKSGQKIWEVQTTDTTKPLYITGAPKVFRGKVIIGNGGTEVSAARGYLTAYDANTGEFAWRFWVVPGNPADGFEDEAMAMAAKTWKGEWWKVGGGGNTWHGITYDPDYNQVLIGTGNGSPWNQKIRSPGGGDNLFLCSIVALDADTGKYKWHYQTVPGETWDYNSSMDIVLAELPVDGAPRKVLMHAPKNGFFYVIDRADGKLISAEAIAKTTWASKIDLATGRPVEVEGSRYEDGEAEVYPSPFGAHSWHAMSYNPKTGLVYIPTIEMAGVFKDTGIDLVHWTSPKLEVDPGVAFADGDTPGDASTAALLAWDPVKQKKVWAVSLPPIWNPGTMTSAGGLVFEGRADGEFVAYDARTGKALWSRNLGVGISAPPITYTVGGVQYVSVLAGWGGAGLLAGTLAAQHGWQYKAHPRRLYTFALDATAEMPPSPPPRPALPIDDPAIAIDGAQAALGGKIYARSCALCHGGGAVSGGSAPDLRASPVPLSSEGFAAVVVKGERSPAGMPSFPDLKEGELGELRSYIRSRARESLQAAAGGTESREH